MRTVRRWFRDSGRPGLRTFLDCYRAQRVILRHSSGGDLAVGDVKHFFIGDDTVNECLLNDEPLVLQFARIHEFFQMLAVQLQLTHYKFHSGRASGEQVAALLGRRRSSEFFVHVAR